MKGRIILHQIQLARLSHMAKLNETTGITEFIEFDIEPGSKRVKLNIEGPKVQLRGPWTFEIDAMKYFNSK